MSKAFLQTIFVTPQAGAAMQRVREVEALAGRGLAGDRYLLGTGYYSALGACEVTLIEAEALERMEAGFGVHVSQGEHRRNLVTPGIAHAEWPCGSSTCSIWPRGSHRPRLPLGGHAGEL